MIFITGASGLLGAHITRTLLAQGFALRALRRPSTNLGALQDVAPAIDWVEGDLLDVSLLKKALQGCRQVVHCAGLVSFSPKDTDKLYTTNVEGTRGLVDAALAEGIERFVHISSVAAIGRPRRSGVVDESQKWEPSALNSWYGETKYLGELEVWRGHTEGMPSTIFNPSVVLGPAPLHRSSTQLFSYVKNQHRFYPPGLINWVDVRDVCTLVLMALQGSIPAGERYIVSAGAVPYQEMFRQIADCLGVRSPYVEANSFLTAGAYYLEKIKGIIGQKQPLLTKETVKLSNLEIVFNNFKITNGVDYHFHPLENTIAWCCQELRPYLR